VADNALIHIGGPEIARAMMSARSPLGRAGTRRIALLRWAVTEVRTWERSCGTPDQRLTPWTAKTHAVPMPFAPHIFELEWLQRRLDAAERRAWRRIDRRPDQFEIHARQNALHLQAYDRRAWDELQLRLENEQLRAELAAVGRSDQEASHA